MPWCSKFTKVAFLFTGNPHGCFEGGSCCHCSESILWSDCFKLFCLYSFELLATEYWFEPGTRGRGTQESNAGRLQHVYALPGLNCINQIQLSGRTAGSWVQTIKKALRITRTCPWITPCITWFHLECQRPGSISSSSNLREGLKLQKYE